MNVTSEMVEAASVAMCDGFEVKWTDLHQHEREQHRKIMRAALEAAIALMRGQSEGLSGKVRDAKFGLAMIEVDCAYFGPHMIGPGDSVRIFVEQKAAKKKDPADEQ